MKKKILGIIAVVAIAAFSGYHAYSSRNNANLSDLTMANIDALAQTTEVDFGVICATVCRDCWCYYVEDDYFADGKPVANY